MALGLNALRRRCVTAPLMKWYKGVLPEMSDTERQALEAGDVWWDAEVFSGKPDWDRLRGLPQARLSDRERQFLDGPVEEFCAMIEDWDVEFARRDLPPEAWEFLKRHKFFGMIIPEAYDGLEFSAYAHSEVVRKISTRNVSAAVTVMVPNSLGPGELLMLYGAKEQKEHYLPRLARGEEIPCFALTEPAAGSDASAMESKGVVCHGEWNGERTLGMRITWDKRYMTLGPVSTIMGLAFKLTDPDHLLGEETDLGITVALMPTDLAGVEMDPRHFPLQLAFQNGPTRGQDVFVPLDHIIGGKEQTGQGWKMLMGALAAGRGISLPSLSTAAAQLAARTTGAYARIREQFDLPIGKFEGVREGLARIAGTAYLLDSGRKLTTVGIDQGEHPAIVSAIMKYHATMRMRDAVNDAMDIHGGKAICAGPKNYLESVYRSVPIGITVEGANILTRSLIIFGQGATRCHPYLTDEMNAVAMDDPTEGLIAFDKALWGHIGHDVANLWRSWFHNFTRGRFAAAPKDAGALAPYYQQLSRASAALAVAAEISLGVLGGALKRKEAISARLGDVLAELYLLSAALKRFEDDGRPDADLPLVQWCFKSGLLTIEQRLDEVARNFPSKFWGGAMRFFTLSSGRWREAPSDDLMNACAEYLLTPGEARERLTHGVYLGAENQPLAQLEDALKRIVAVEPLRKRMREAGVEDPDAAAARGILNESEAGDVKRALDAVRRVIEVDEFSNEALTQGRHSWGQTLEDAEPIESPPRAVASSS